MRGVLVVVEKKEAARHRVTLVRNIRFGHGIGASKGTGGADLCSGGLVMADKIAMDHSH